MSTSLHRPPPGGNVDHGWQLEVGVIVTFVSASVAVGLRTFARSRYTRMGWDDYVMLFALVSSACFHQASSSS